MGCHPRLEPFKFLSVHESVVRDPTKKIRKKCYIVESREMNVGKFDNFGPRTTYLFLGFGNLVVTP